MPKKRTLPYIILGILASQDNLNGRQITNQFQNEIGEFWKATHSQIYPELKKMVNDGWISKNTREDNDKEIYYNLTTLGKDKLTAWIKEPLTELGASQDLFSLKLFFIKDQNDPELKRLVQEEIELCQNQLAHLRDRESLLFQSITNQQKNYGHYLILKRAISRLEGQVNWLKSLKL